MGVTQKIRRPGIAILISLLMFSSISGGLFAFSQKAYAAATDGAIVAPTIDEAIQRKNYYMFVRSCFERLDIDEVTETEVNNWDYFQGAAHAKYEIVGNYFGAAKSATWDCTDESKMQAAFNSLGFTDSRAFFCALSGSRIIRDDTWNNNEYDDNQTCYSGDWPGHDKWWDNNQEDNGKLRESFTSLVTNPDASISDGFTLEHVGGHPEVGNGLPGYAQYLRFYTSFMYQCGAGDARATLGEYKKNDSLSSTEYKIAIVDSDTIKKNPGYEFVKATGQLDSGSQVAIEATVSGSEYKDGYGANDGVAKDDIWPKGDVQSCKEVADNINKYAKDYADKLKSDPHLLDGATTLGSDGDGADGADDALTACETIDTTALRWITCPLLNMAQSALSGLDKLLRTFLYVDINQVFSQANQDGLSVFRNLGLGLLVITGLFMVISQAAGLEILDAYTVRKIFPRLFAAAIGIAVAWPLMQFIVTIFNDFGIWAHDLIVGAFNVERTSGNDTPAVLVGLLSTGAGILAFANLGIAGLLSLLWTGVLALLVGLIVLTLRQLIIIVCVLVAPLAIAAYILPGTQKLWKFWKDAFITSLMMFPIVMAILASGQALSGLMSNGGAILKLMSVIAYLAPYFALPFAFKMAGGLVSTLTGIASDRSRGLFDQQKKYRAEHSAARRERFGRRVLAKRADITQGLQDRGSKSGALGNFAYRTAARGIGGYNIYAQQSARQAAVAKEINDQIATGADDEIRALTAKKGADGKYRSLAGREVSEAAYRRAQSRWGNDRFAQQAALSYEMRKASTEQEAANIANGYTDIAKNTWGMSDQQLNNAWIGSAFENQNQHLGFKNMRAQTDAGGKIVAGSQMSMTNNNGGKGFDSFVDEVYNNRGSYNMAQMRSSTIKELMNAYNDPSAGADRKEKIASIAETFMNEMGAARSDTGAPESAPTGGGGTSRRANTPGAAHVAERVAELTRMTRAGAGGTGPSVHDSAPGGNFSQGTHDGGPHGRTQT